MHDSRGHRPTQASELDLLTALQHGAPLTVLAGDHQGRTHGAHCHTMHLPRGALLRVMHRVWHR